MNNSNYLSASTKIVIINSKLNSLSHLSVYYFYTYANILNVRMMFSESARDIDVKNTVDFS